MNRVDNATPLQGWPQGPTAFETRLGNNTTRIVVALIGIPLVLGLVWLGGWPFAGLVAAMSVGAQLEFYWMLEKKDIRPDKMLGVVAGLLLLLTFTHGDVNALLGTGRADAESLLRIAVLVLVPVAALVLQLRHDNSEALINVMGTLTGVFYVPVLMGTLLGLHHVAVQKAPMLLERSGLHAENLLADGTGVGAAVVLVVFAGIWTCDSFAYFGGRAFGKHKLFERVSPKKTWEGALSGAVGGIAVCIVLAVVLDGLVWQDGLVIGLAAGVLGQVGDLAESHLKRACNVKDSSQIIPGHGGILDRFDSLLFVAPVVYLYMLFVS